MLVVRLSGFAFALGRAGISGLVWLLGRGKSSAGHGCIC